MFLFLPAFRGSKHTPYGNGNNDQTGDSSGSCLSRILPFFVCENSVPVHITSFILDEKAEHPHRLGDYLKKSIDVTVLQIALYIVLQTAMRINTCEWARRMRDILHPRRLWSLYIVLH